MLLWFLHLFIIARSIIIIYHLRHRGHSASCSFWESLIQKPFRTTGVQHQIQTLVPNFQGLLYFRLFLTTQLFFYNSSPFCARWVHFLTAPLYPAVPISLANSIPWLSCGMHSSLISKCPKPSYPWCWKLFNPILIDNIVFPSVEFCWYRT